MRYFQIKKIVMETFVFKTNHSYYLAIEKKERFGSIDRIHRNNFQTIMIIAVRVFLWYQVGSRCRYPRPSPLCSPSPAQTAPPPHPRLSMSQGRIRRGWREGRTHGVSGICRKHTKTGSAFRNFGFNLDLNIKLTRQCLRACIEPYCWLLTWCLNQMVPQNKLHTHKAKLIFFLNKKQICDCV